MKQAHCDALKAAANWPPELLECTVVSVEDSPDSGGVAVVWQMIYKVASVSDLAAATKSAASLVGTLRKASGAAIVFGTKVRTVTLLAGFGNAYRKVVTLEANVYGDPHFVGFDGRKFDYQVSTFVLLCCMRRHPRGLAQLTRARAGMQGVRDRRYTLLSDAGMKVTSLFRHAPNTPLASTVMGDAVVTVGKDVVKVTLVRESKKLYLNGK
jgi:hypothetical protein